ncbi:type III secretion system protein PrgE [Lactococcus petauri]|uniref:type III secretion system protein PrgE n=1 Tax=Lactococcus petauri TaxID=1940789 RepID=UPI001F569FCC|nr:type III secretion system protein PrgE [Lactococcus petauri]
MRYKRPTGNRNEKKEFALGVHEAEIKFVKMKQSSKGNDVFLMLLKGEEGETAFFNFTFGKDFTEENMNYLLASIEDHGVDIPDLAFDYSQETADFLKGQTVYILVEEKEFKGEVQHAVSAFFTQEEYEDFIVEQSENGTE